jgi:hypothetical protein
VVGTDGLRLLFSDFLTSKEHRLGLLLLRFRFNTELVRGKMNHNQHSTVSFEIHEAEQLAKSNTCSARDRVVKSQEQLSEQLFNVRTGWGFWNKDTDFSRMIIRQQLLQALSDWAGLLMFLILLVTVYRVPALWRDMRRTGSVLFIHTSAKLVLLCHLRAMAQDIGLMCQILGLLVCLAITLVRIFDFIYKIPSIDGLRSCRDTLRTEVGTALFELWELISFVFVNKLYRFLVKAVLFSILVPAVCLSELVSTAFRCVPQAVLKLRFAICVVLWGCIVAAPVVLVVHFFPAHLGDSTYIQRSLLTIALVVHFLLLGSILSQLHQERFFAVPSRRWASPFIRCTWPNGILFLGSLLEPAQLVAALLWASSVSDGDWAKSASSAPVTQAVNALLFVDDTGYAAWFWSAFALSVVWLLAAALPLVLDQAQEDGYEYYTTPAARRAGMLRQVPEIRHRPFYFNMAAIVSQTLFIPIVLNLWKPVWCWYDDPQPHSSGVAQNSTNATGVLIAAPSEACWVGQQVMLAAVGMVALLTFLFTTQGLRASEGLKDLEDTKLDIHFPVLFTVTTQWLELGILCICLFRPLQPAVQYPLLVGLSAALVVWNLIYSKLLGVDCCTVPVMVAVKFSAALLVLYTAVCAMLLNRYPELFAVESWSFLHVLVYGLAAIAALSLPLAIIVNRSAARMWEESLQRSGHADAVAALLKLDAKIRSRVCIPKRFVVL